jgi:uncharacterized membrane protein YvlD (DUF360 family)
MFALVTLVLAAGLLVLLADVTSGIRLDGFNAAFWAALTIYLAGMPLMLLPRFGLAADSFWALAAVMIAKNLLGLGLAHLFVPGFQLRGIVVTVVAAVAIAAVDIGVPFTISALIGALSS